MKIFYPVLLVVVVLIFPFQAFAARSERNLIANPAFQNLDTAGFPKNWFGGSFGENSPTFGRVVCTYYTDEDILNNGANVTNYYDTVHRPGCPPNTHYRLEVRMGNFKSGDAKLYFADIPINGNKFFDLSFQYQSYSWRAQATARYLMKDGSYQYVLIANMPQLENRAMGYVNWSAASYHIDPPKKAVAMTVFFSVKGDSTGGCPIAIVCKGPDYGTLSIANVVLKQDK